MNKVEFQERVSIEQVEEGTDLAPKFDMDGLLPCITTDAKSGEVLMLGWMNSKALQLTIETGEAHYFSRSRQVLWHKGASSGLVQRVIKAKCRSSQIGCVMPCRLSILLLSCNPYGGKCRKISRIFGKRKNF